MTGRLLILAAGALIVGAGAAQGAKAPITLPDPPRLRDPEPLRQEPGRPSEQYGSITGSRLYRKCIANVRTNADAAYDEAMLWRDQGGGAAAGHCAAMALAKLGQHEEAARRLVEIAGAEANVKPELRAEIYAQAGLLWQFAGRHEPAHEAFSQALGVAPTDDPNRPQYLFDRAQAAANLGRWRDTVNDLTQAIAIGEAYVAAFVLRGRAYRALGDRVSARNDLDAALTLSPGDPAALLERGQVRRDMRDLNGARADWLRAANQDNDAEIAGAARAKLAELDADMLKPPCPDDGKPAAQPHGERLDLAECRE